MRKGTIPVVLSVCLGFFLVFKWLYPVTRDAEIFLSKTAAPIVITEVLSLADPNSESGEEVAWVYYQFRDTSKKWVASRAFIPFNHINDALGEPDQQGGYPSARVHFSRWNSSRHFLSPGDALNGMFLRWVVWVTRFLMTILGVIGASLAVFFLLREISKNVGISAHKRPA